MTKSLLDQLRKHNPKLIYVNPTFQNPTGEVLDIDDRLRILTLARELQVPVVDDDPYRELWFAENTPPRLRDLSPHPLDPVVITLGTVSKLLSPALRLGWIVANRIVLNRLSKLKQISDLHTSLFAQTAVLFYLQEERLELHMKDIRIRYQARRDKMIDALRQYLPQGEFRVPQGGFYVWCKLPGISSSDLYYLALEQGVAFVPGPSFFSGDGGEEWLRLSYASPPAEAIEEVTKSIHRTRYEIFFEYNGNLSNPCENTPDF